MRILRLTLEENDGRQIHRASSSTYLNFPNAVNAHWLDLALGDLNRELDRRMMRWDGEDLANPFRFTPTDRALEWGAPPATANLGPSNPIGPGDTAPQLRNAPPLGSQPVGRPDPDWVFGH